MLLRVATGHVAARGGQDASVRGNGKRLHAAGERNTFRQVAERSGRKPTLSARAKKR